MSEQVQPIRVAVSVPAGDDVKTGFAFDLANMVAATAVTRPDVGIRLHTVKGSILPKSREDLVFMALEHDYTHLLFLDTDMRFPRNALLRLLARNEYIVGVNYTTRRPPAKPVTFKDDSNADIRVYTSPDSTGLEEVASTGFGCMLIDLDVFRSISRPWFVFTWDEKIRNWIGEDVHFCRKAREELNAKVYIDHDLSKEISHIGEFEYRHEHVPTPEPAAPKLVTV